MKIAVTYENGEIFAHFGHTEHFKIYDVENGKVLSSQVVDTNGSGHGALAEFLADLGVDTLICGGIGGGALMALGGEDIQIFAGNSGKADDAVSALLSGNLTARDGECCSHHHHHDDDGECHCHDHEHHHHDDDGECHCHHHHGE